MVRLWRDKSSQSESVIKVEGQLMAEWVALVEDECLAEAKSGRTVVLDLGDVTFVDGRGLAMLRGLSRKSIVLKNITPLLQDQLNDGGKKS